MSKTKELAKSRWVGLGWGLVGWAQCRARAWGKGWKEARSTLVLEGSLEKAHRCSATFFPGRAFLVLPDQSASDVECSGENENHILHEVGIPRYPGVCTPQLSKGCLAIEWLVLL